ncbi:MAG: hypothetical protein IJU58_00060 [Clostridia bacterium]|nr:hypothetical protein [Clostridia bacterium]
MQLSNIIGLPVYSIYECEYVGYVLKGIFNHSLSKINNLVVEDDENEIDYTINIRNIYKINNDCILIRNKTKLNVSSTQDNSIINNTILTLEGQKDVVKDVLLDDNFCVLSIQGKKLSFNHTDILCKQNDIIMLKSNNQNIKRKNFRPRLKHIPNVKEQTTQPVSILDNIAHPTPIKANNVVNIIGKHLSDNLYSRQNEILAVKNSVITQSTINIARQFNVFNQLIALAK